MTSFPIILSLSVLLAGSEKSQGGVAGNIAYSLALLGEKPILLASIGRDQTDYITKLAGLGVDVTQVHYSSLATASFTVITDRAGRQIGGFYPGAMSEASQLNLTKFKDQNALIIVSAHDPVQMALQLNQAAKLKLRLFFDLGQQVAALEPEIIKIGLSAAEVLLVNDFELDLLAKKTNLSRAEIFSLTPVVIVTLGGDGINIYDRRTASNNPKKVSAVQAKLVDPTGAGDAFRAGFLYGYIRDWSLEKCSQLGAVVAVLAVESHGAQLHKLNRLELAKRYELQYHQPLNWD